MNFQGGAKVNFRRGAMTSCQKHFANITCCGDTKLIKLQHSP